MAIRTETYMLGERQFTRTWSDSNCYVVHDGVSYSEANDPTELGRTYVEGEVMPSDEIESQAQEILNILLGGEGE